MTVFIVVWQTPSAGGVLGSALNIYSLEKSKTFSTREKAESFVSSLIDAANLIGVSIDPHISESAIE